MRRRAHSDAPLGPDAAFICQRCNQCVPGAAPGSEHRNHCPHCLWSLHVDADATDPSHRCGGTMEPIGVSLQAGGAWSIVHRCRRCNCMRINRIAGDDNELALLSLAVRPLAQPPFPLDGVALAARAGERTDRDTNIPGGSSE
jgi:hypothetical protein